MTAGTTSCGAAGSGKLDTLYDSMWGGAWATLRPGFEEKPIRIVDTLQGDTLRVALDAYRELRDYSFDNNGERPEVFAIQKDGVTYAYGMAVSGRSYGNWGTLRVYDREFDELGEFTFSD